MEHFWDISSLLKCDSGNGQYDYKRGYTKNKSITKTERQNFTYKVSPTFHIHQLNIIKRFIYTLITIYVIWWYECCNFIVVIFCYFLLLALRMAENDPNWYYTRKLHSERSKIFKVRISKILLY